MSNGERTAFPADARAPSLGLEGLTKREHFAALLMVATLDRYGITETGVGEAATVAVRAADALLRALDEASR